MIFPVGVWNTHATASLQMENIGNFLEGCYAYGCVKNDMFQTVDLYEAQNMPQVSNAATVGLKMKCYWW